MENIAHMVKFCPFLARTPLTKLRTMAAMKTSSSSSSSLLVMAAQKCPILGPALLVEGAKNISTSSKCSHMMAAVAVDNSFTPSSNLTQDSAPQVQQNSNAYNENLNKCPSGQNNKNQEANVSSQPNPSPANSKKGHFDYDAFFNYELDKKHQDRSYRYFNNINRLARSFPTAHTGNGNHVTVWCSNDYLGMSRHHAVIDSMRETLSKYGAGAGGTRNIAGNAQLHLSLEHELATLHRKQSALVFSSCFVANDATLSTLASKMPGCVIFSDSSNHASMIQGIRHSGAKKMIFKHNDVKHLETLLQSVDINVPKIIAFESVYSMCGSIGPIKKICELAKQYNALTFLDEVHAVGMYGATGAGVAEYIDEMANVDIITGTLGKAYGVVGGYIAGSANLVDMIRSYAPGFIFTTSLPPAIVSGALTSVKYLKQSNVERSLQQLHTRELKFRLSNIGIPVVPNPSHIVPVLVGDAEICKQVSDELLNLFNIYVQSINYPTVSKGEERLRITPTPGHHEGLMDVLVSSLQTIWEERKLKTEEQWAELGGRAGVGCANVPYPQQLVGDHDLILDQPLTPIAATA